MDTAREPERAGGVDRPRRRPSASPGPARRRGRSRWRWPCSRRSGRRRPRAAPNCRRGGVCNPQRTSSRMRTAPVRSQSRRKPVANAGSGSSRSTPMSWRIGLTTIPATSSPARLHRRLHRGQVVEAVLDQMGPVLGQHTPRGSGCTRVGPVVGARRHQDLPLAGGGPGDGDALGGGVGPVLREDGPVGVVHRGRSTPRPAPPCGATARSGSRPRAACRAAASSTRGWRCPSTTGPVAAHQIDVLVAVDVPHVRTRAHAA